MRPGEATKFLDIFAGAANVPVMLWGAPGTGKTSAVEHWAKQRGMDITVLIGSLLDPTEIGGLPMIQERASVNGDGSPTVRNVTSYVLPEWFIKIVETPERPHVLFLDELNASPPAVQVAMLRLIQSRAIHDVELPDNCRIIAAGNDSKQMSLAMELPSAMCSRMAHIDWERATADEAAEGEEEGWPVPAPYPTTDAANVPAALTKLRAITGAYRRSNPAANEDFTDNDGRVAADGRGYPCPRSWSNLERVLAHIPIGDEDALLTAAQAIIGRGPGTEFAVYAADMDLPNPEEWLADPSKATALPTDDRTFVALATVVGSAINTTDDRWYAALKCVLTVAKERSAGIATRSVISLLKNPPSKRRASALKELHEVFSETLKATGLLPEGAA